MESRGSSLGHRYFVCVTPAPGRRTRAQWVFQRASTQQIISRDADLSHTWDLWNMQAKMNTICELTRDFHCGLFERKQLS